MKYIFIQLLTLILFFQGLLTSSFIVSEKSPKEKSTQKNFDSLYNKINTIEHQIQWLTRSASDQQELIAKLKKSKTTAKENKDITIIENEICTIAHTKSNGSKDKQLELISQQVKLQSELLELLGYTSRKPVEKNNEESTSCAPEQLNFLKITIAKHIQDIETLKQTSNAPVCKVTQLEKEIEILKKESSHCSKQNTFSQIHLLDEQAKLQATLLTLLRYYE